jgi:hypothetical protein
VDDRELREKFYQLKKQGKLLIIEDGSECYDLPTQPYDPADPRVTCQTMKRVDLRDTGSQDAVATT